MTRNIVDLTLPIQEGMQTFPVHWHPMVEISQLGRIGVEERVTRKLVLGTHTGTHMDAPSHFIADGKGLDDIPLSQLVGPAHVMDFSDAKPFQELCIDAFEERLKDVTPERVLMRFDWSDNYNTPIYYSDHPFISEKAAQWLVDRGCKLLAMDTPMPDNPANGRGTCNDSPNHKILLGNDVVLVEYLTNTRSLTKPVVELVVAPLKIVEGDGSPVRCFAIEQD